MGVPGTHSNFYARWRAQNEARLFLGERDAAHPPERLLQSIWLHQRLRREELQTLDGQPLRVLHPGFWNRAAGPDFHGAVLQFGHEPARSGDVEIDLRSRQLAGARARGQSGLRRRDFACRLGSLPARIASPARPGPGKVY